MISKEEARVQLMKIVELLSEPDHPPAKWLLTNEMAHVAELLGETKKIHYTFKSMDSSGVIEGSSYTHDHDLYELVRSIDAFYSSRR